MLGMFLAALDQTIVATSIRTIADDLDGLSLQAWATTGYLITATISTPLYGKLSDLYGRKPLFLAAISIFVLGSVACAFTGSMYELAAARAVQGLGAGGLFSLALTIIGDIVSPRERAKYQGYFVAVFGTSSVLGPVLGGLLAGQAEILGIAGWRWVFLINVPLGILALVVVTKVLNLPHTRRDHRIDWPGALALIVFLVPLLIVAEQGRTWGWGDAKSLVCYVVGAVGFVLFVLAERAYKDEALLPLRMFKNRTFAVSGLSSIVLGMGMFGGILLLPQYLQIVHGSSPTVAGLQMIPLVLGIMIGSVISGQTIARTGVYKPFPLIGVLLMVASLVSLSFVVDATTSVWTLVPFMLMLGFGLGFNFQPVILAVQNAVSPREIGVATSSVTFFRQMGGTLGTAIFLSVLFTRLPGDIGSAISDAAATDPRVAQAVQSGQLRAGGSLSDTSFIQQLPPFLAAPFKSGFSHSLDVVFLLAAIIVALGFFVLIFLPQLALRTQSGIQAAQAGAGEAGDEGAAQAAVHAAGAAAPTSTEPPVDGADRTGEQAGRHQAAAHQPTGLDSVPADHLPDGVRNRN
jgi:EmrB/QacA subfamily drug resistance transporter